MKGAIAQQAIDGVKGWLGKWANAWNSFWFTPRSLETIALMRIATGAMLCYTHLVIALDLSSFLGADAWIRPELARQLHDGTYGFRDWGWSYLWSLESPAILWGHQVIAILVTFAMAIGLGTRVVVPIAWWIQLMMMHRLTGALFGLDQVTTMLVTYLMLTRSGACFSVDAVLRRRLEASGKKVRSVLGFCLPNREPVASATVSTRLMQIHLCVIYLFGGLWKARGEMWWDGTAMWFAAANAEYRSTDLTWLAYSPALFATLTHLTVFWEVFYPALVWPRMTRPLVLVMAVLVHGGIAIYLGMITFGLMMIVANGAFVEPRWIVSLRSREQRRRQ